MFDRVIVRLSYDNWEHNLHVRGKDANNEVWTKIRIANDRKNDPLVLFLKKFGKRRWLSDLFEWMREWGTSWNVSYKAFYAAWRMRQNNPPRLVKTIEKAKNAKQFCALAAFQER